MEAPWHQCKLRCYCNNSARPWLLDGKVMQTCHYGTADCSGRTSGACEAPPDTVSRVGICGSSTFGDSTFQVTKHSCDTTTVSGGGISFGSVCILLLVVAIGVLLVMGYRKYNARTQDFGGGTDFTKLTDSVGTYN